MNTYAQNHDSNWVLGYHGQSYHPLQNNIIIDFFTTPPSINGLSLSTGMSFNATDASISDSTGNLLFYSNGIYVADASHNIMENGDSINNVGITHQYDETGLTINQGALILPYPGHDSLYMILHVPVDYVSGSLGVNIPFLFMSTVNMNKNNGLGSLITKDEIVIEDTLGFGKITACKHANGRDWWFLMQEDDQMNNGIYTLLLTPTGIENMGKQEFSIPVLNAEPSVGNALFTPDGSKYIRSDIRFDPWNAVTIYDFDRCTGALSPLEYFEIEDTTFLYGGVTVSPDSRYLYCITTNIIYQFDLTAPNIASTKSIVAVYDGFVGFFFPTLFGTPQLAPDGSIWIASTSDTTMHVIRTPNQPGTACHVDQHAIHLPKINQKSIPNFPNYRLGPLDGSPCDTLGLDNHPLAGFTWWPDELAVTFSDNSYYRPETWVWDFGEPTGSSGNTSMERNPLHSYDTPGEYYVCLIVSNEYDSDTICHWVQVDTLTTMVDVTALPDAPVNGVAVHPNPASEHVSITLRYPLGKPGEWVLYSAVGERVLSRAIPVGSVAVREVSLAGLPPGLYFWSVEGEGRKLGSGKLIILQ